MEKTKIVGLFERIANKFAKNKYLIVIREGMVLSMPLILIGSLFLVIAAMPIKSFENLLISLNLLDKLYSLVNSTFGLMGLVATFGIAKKMAEIRKVDGVSSGLIAVCSYIFIIPKTDGFLNMGYLGSKGMFIGIIVGIFVGELFSYLIRKNIVIKMPENVPPAVSKSFTSIIPGIIIMSIFFVLNTIVESYNTDFFQIVLKVIAMPLKGISDSYIGTVIAILLNGFFWIFGIHGGQLVGSIMDPVWFMNTDANRLAYQAGEALPHIVTKPFLDNFAWVGGSGACLGLAIYLFFMSRSTNLKTLGKISFVPDIFSVNEPMLFGIPIILNINLLIPFILTPVVTGTISYVATSLGLVARTTGVVIPWATPPIISGYLSTGGSISGPILQMVNIFVAFLIYYPFIKKLDNKFLKEESENK